MSGELGRIVPPYPRDTCSADDCGHQPLTEDTGAYLHRNLNAPRLRLVVLCGPCSRAAELHAREWLPLVSS